jgi:GxxExxY protein
MKTAEDAEEAEGKRLNEITGAVVDAAMKIHTALGPGLLESVYEKCLKHELSTRGLHAQTQVWLPVAYDRILIEGGYKIDLLVEGKVVVELKVAERALEIHKSSVIVLPET